LEAALEDNSVQATGIAVRNLYWCSRKVDRDGLLEAIGRAWGREAARTDLNGQVSEILSGV
jgi:hypothetical protein